MADKSSTTNRKIYGRGMFDGLRAAGLNPEQFMRDSKLNQLAKTLTGVTKKTFDAVPVSNPWTRHQIHKELSRTGRYDVASVDSQLIRLTELGLIYQVTPGHFLRRVPSEPKQLTTRTEKHSDNRPESVQNDPSVLDRMAEIAARARLLADEIDELALHADEMLKKAESRAEKLKILQSLLKD